MKKMKYNITIYNFILWRNPKSSKTVYIPIGEENDVLEQFLTVKRGSKVYVKVPIKGEKKEMMELVKNNAKATLENLKIK